MKKKVVITIMMVLMIITINNTCFATGFSTWSFKGVGDIIGSGKIITNMASAIFWAVRLAGVAIAVIYITILGMKYMTSSVEDRADIKKKLVPFVTGAAIFFGVSFIIELILDIASWI